MSNKYDEKNANERSLYLDLLRIIGSIFVVGVHVVAQNFEKIEVGGVTTRWGVYNIFGSFFRIGVPIFVMISGSIFLNSSYNVNLHKVRQKSIRLLKCYAFWALIYSVFYKVFADTPLSKTFFEGKHLWFLPMIIGLYAITPFLKEIIKDEILERYLLILGFSFGFLAPTIFTIAEDFFPSYTVIKEIHVFVNNFYIYLPLGYTFYFLLGHKISNGNSITDSKWVYIFMLVSGFCITALLTYYCSLPNHVITQDFYDYLTINVCAESVGLFQLIRMAFKRTYRVKEHRFLHVWSRETLGVYILHVMILAAFKYFGISTLSFSPIASIIIMMSFVYASSFIISLIIRKIPIINSLI